MEPTKRCIREIVGNINIIPNTINIHSVPRVLGSAVCTAVAIDDVARDILAAADSRKETGDIVAYSRLGLPGFANIGILIKAFIVMIAGEILGHPRIYRNHFLFIGSAGTDPLKVILVLRSPKHAGTVGQRITDCRRKCSCCYGKRCCGDHEQCYVYDFRHRLVLTVWTGNKVLGKQNCRRKCGVEPQRSAEVKGIDNPKDENRHRKCIGKNPLRLCFYVYQKQYSAEIG